MDWPGAFYFAACLLIPALWGWLVHRLFLRWKLLPRSEEARPRQPAEGMDDWHYQI